MHECEHCDKQWQTVCGYFQFQCEKSEIFVANVKQTRNTQEARKVQILKNKNHIIFAKYLCNSIKKSVHIKKYIFLQAQNAFALNKTHMLFRNRECSGVMCQTRGASQL